jgi:hypothetical protein
MSEQKEGPQAYGPCCINSVHRHAATMLSCYGSAKPPSEHTLRNSIWRQLGNTVQVVQTKIGCCLLRVYAASACGSAPDAQPGTGTLAS